MADQPLSAFNLSIDPTLEFGPFPAANAAAEKLRKLEQLQALRDQLAMMAGPKPRQSGNTTPGAAMLRAGAGRVAEGIANIPGALMEGAANFYGTAAGAGTGFTPRGFQPDRLAMPFLPGGQDFLGAVDTAGEAAAAMATGDMTQFSPDAGEAARLRSEIMAQEQPGATQTGQILGDVASIVGLRQPIARARNATELAEANRAQLARVVEKPVTAEAAKAVIADEVRNAANIPDMLQRMSVKSDSFNALMNRAGRSAEAGLEGAVIGIMQDRDPVEMAAMAAGGQMAGSALLGMLGSVTRGGLQSTGLNLLLAAGSTTALIQAAKEVTPGGKDFALESFESAVAKVTLGVAAGVMAGLTGQGRLPIRAIPRVADAMTAVPRAALLSVVNDATSDPRVETVINKLAMNPEYFGVQAMRRMERAYRNPDISISGVVDDLMESNKEFRDKYRLLERTR
jgi:hypothetical protein